MPKLYDQFGREIQVGTRPEGRDIAVASIRDRWSTYPSQGLTPARLAQILKEADAGDVSRQAELFTEMEEKDAHLAALLQTRKLAVTGLDYDLEAYDDSSEAAKIADFCRDALFNLAGLEEALFDLLDAVGKGYSLVEIVWETGERAVPRAFRWVEPKKVSFAQDLVPRVLTDASPGTGEELPPFKFIYHRYRARSGHDTRAGLLRVCAWMYLFKNYGLKDWLIFAERYGMPVRLGRYEPGASQTDRDALLAAVTNLGTDAAGIISKATEIEFVEVAQKTGAAQLYQALVELCNREMSKAIRGSTLTSDAGSGGSGSYALGKVHGEVAHTLVCSDAWELAKTLRGQLLFPLVGFNFGWDKAQALLPWWRFDIEEPEDLEQTAKVLATVRNDLGYGDIPKSFIRTKFRIPEPQEGEEVLGPGQPRGGVPAGRFMAAAATGFTPEQEAIEHLVESSLLRSERAFASLAGPVQRAIEESNSYEELRERLMAAYPEMKAGDLEDLLGRAQFVAELHGRATVRAGRRAR